MKQKRSTGKGYVTSKGKVVQPKIFINKDCGCNLECSSKITVPRRNQIFSNFYTMNLDLKNAFVMGSVDVKEKHRTYTALNNSQWANSRSYKLTDECGNVKKICKTYFKDTLQIPDGTITNILARKKTDGTPIEDRRGKSAPQNKNSDEDTEYLQRFICLFPTYQSHYSRKDNQYRNYLPPTLRMPTMYEKYVCSCNENDRTPLSIFVFRRIFNTKFNLHFHHPQSDKCQKCDLFNNKIRCLSEGEEKNAVRRDIIHQEMAEKAKEKMKEDTLDPHTNPNKRVLVFDLQKTLPTPVLSTEIAYYKRQMWTYNLGIHDENLKTGFMYVWSEEQASRGTQDIGSCILEHVFRHIPETVTHLILYSDSCGGQNRNIKMSLMLQYIFAQISISENH